MRLAYVSWLIAMTLGAVSAALSAWRLGGRWWVAGAAVLGLFAGLGAQFLCDCPYVCAEIAFQRRSPASGSRRTLTALYILRAVSGMVLAWFVPAGCVAFIAARFTG